ncbi:MAG: DNA-binding protein [Planctomycetota bacterium]|nr:MAG: DNA-binding protein [Planctomycetota bacterium]
MVPDTPTPGQREALSDREFANRYGLNPKTPAVWRNRGQGPRFIRLGRAVRYRLADIEAWLANGGEEAVR